MNQQVLDWTAILLPFLIPPVVLFWWVEEKFDSLIEGRWGIRYESVGFYLKRKDYFEIEGGYSWSDIDTLAPYTLYLKDKAFFVLPYIQALCKLNAEACEEQERLLKERWGEWVLPLVFERDYSDELRSLMTSSYWRKQELQDRRELVEFLFKFTVLEDGIRNNEWNKLMQWMMDLRFNNNYIDYFKKRYASLRTEFDEYQRSSSSSSNYSASYLKPYYSVLGLQEGATDEEIKRAYHELALQHHPDLPKNAARIEECEAMMAKINLAYEKVMG
ncbi:MAG: J domain-containing protein [Paludibacteraceae bacterium]|nr:J domain-containing protein [Paludibacteraceae bacterium]